MTISQTRDLQGIADRVVEVVRSRAEASDATIEANVLVHRRHHGLTRFANSFIHQHVGEDTVSVQLTLSVDRRTTSATSTRVDDDELAQLVDDAIAAAVLQPVDPHWAGATPPAVATIPDVLDQDIVAMDPSARAALVRDFVDAGEGLRAAGYVDTAHDEAAFASTAGQRIAGATTRATIDGIHQTPTSAGSGHQTSRRLADLDATSMGTLAAGRARRCASFEDLEPGSYPVVLGPDAVATILTFLAFYGFNAKTHLEGGSFVRLGEQQFDPAISLWQNPLDPRAISLPFDAEGTPRTRYPLIERGVSTTLSQDRRTAARMGTISTGDALAGSGAHGAMGTSLVLPNGDVPPEELIARVERGLLVTTFNYVRVLDPKTVVSTGLTRNSTFLIEDGKVGDAVGNLRFTQSFISALGTGQILGMGDDSRYADGEFGIGLVLCPSMALAGWSFTGNARG